MVRVSWPNLDQNYRPMFNLLHEGFSCKKRTWPINSSPLIRYFQGGERQALCFWTLLESLEGFGDAF